MKIAIVSEEKGLGARMDSRFGRCAYFAIYDGESNTTEFSPTRQRIPPREPIGSGKIYRI